MELTPTEKEFENIQDCVHKKVCLLRSMEHFITGDEFKNIFMKLSFLDRYRFSTLIMEGNYNQLKNEFEAKKIEYTALELWTFQNLRNLARKERLPGYGLMNKATLILELKRAKKNEK